MIRLNLMLLLAVIVSAMYLVHTQYESRCLFTALDRAASLALHLQALILHLQLVRRPRHPGWKNWPANN